MEIYKFLLVWILYNIKCGSDATSIECERDNFCYCTRNLYDIEFHCPNEYNWNINIQFQTEHNKVKIQCTTEIDWINEPLPLLGIEDVEYFDYQMCTFPTNFADVMRKLQINNTKRLKFSRSIDLENITLTRHYFIGLQNLERLTLNFVNIKKITHDAFQELDKLTELNLDSNNIELAENAFKHVTQLKSLTLSNNALSYFPPNIFRNLTKLTYLDLSHNRLITINSTTFTNLKNLKTLHFLSAQLKDLLENIFYDLEQLQILDLSTNKLESIPTDLLKYNQLLEVVTMFRNSNLTLLPNHLFSNLTNLRLIILGECKLTNLPNELFDGSINLERIDLQRNKIEYIPTNIFKGLKRLQQLDISYNKIREFSNEVFYSLTELKMLNLQNNLLTAIKTEHLYDLSNLEELNLKNNKIGYIDATSFHGITKLKKIILANNFFDIPRNVELFMNNEDLREVDLSGNNITAMCDFTSFTKLLKLDLSKNQISVLNLSEIFMVAYPITIYLEQNNIRTVYLTETEVLAIGQENRVVFLNGNPLECNCRLYNFVEYLNRRTEKPINIIADELVCSSPHDFVNVPVTGIDPKLLTCSLQELEILDKLTDKCTYRFRPFDKTLVIFCINCSLTQVPQLILPKQNFFTKIETHLEENMLTAGPKENMGYEKVTKLFLSSNLIKEITWIPAELEVLELNNNNISYLNYKILNSSFLTNITLSNNPWKCDCSMVDLISFILSKLSKKQLQIDTNITTITCKDGGHLLFSMRSDVFCPNNKALLLGLGIAVSLTALILAILMASYYRYQEEVKAWLFAHNMILWFVKVNEIDEDKTYDAFISYSHKDEEFVLNEFLPVLEQSSQPYKICLQLRDSVVGELIFNQVTMSVSKSQRTIIILSRNFLESEWGKMEFRTAHIQAIKAGARVILVLYGDIDTESDLDDELKSFVRTNTYIKWGDRWFWDRLRYSLPHSFTKKKSTTQHVSIPLGQKLDKIDDTADLINNISSTSNPDTTPPANHLFTKNNLFKFPVQKNNPIC